MINNDRFARRVAAHGFTFDFESPGEQRTVYYCNSELPDLFLRIEVACRGRAQSGAAAVASVGVTIGHGPNAIAEMRVVPEVAAVPRYGYTPLGCDQDAIDWEARVADTTPALAREMVDTRGRALLSRTEVARRMAHEYLRRLGKLADASIIERRLRPSLDPEQAVQVDQICSWRDTPLFRVAAIAIVLYRREVESDGVDFGDLSPVKNPELMQRVLLVVALLENDGHF